MGSWLWLQPAAVRGYGLRLCIGVAAVRGHGLLAVATAGSRARPWAAAAAAGRHPWAAALCCTCAGHDCAGHDHEPRPCGGEGGIMCGGHDWQVTLE